VKNARRERKYKHLQRVVGIRENTPNQERNWENFKQNRKKKKKVRKEPSRSRVKIKNISELANEASCQQKHFQSAKNRKEGQSNGRSLRKKT